jgi:prepilin signal peptidase PulO-like enzyme (type II secretory pathway)
MSIFMACAAGLFFAVWHSFCDALAWRIYEAFYSPRRKQVTEKYRFVLAGSSRCEACAAPVSAKGLVPVFGFFLVKGRCESCTRRISWRFPVFEALAFFYGFALGTKNLAPAEFSIAIVVYALLWVIIATDYRVLLIPTEAILGLLVTASSHWWLFAIHCGLPSTALISALILPWHSCGMRSFIYCELRRAIKWVWPMCGSCWRSGFCSGTPSHSICRVSRLCSRSAFICCGAIR